MYFNNCYIKFNACFNKMVVILTIMYENKKQTFNKFQQWSNIYNPIMWDHMLHIKRFIYHMFIPRFKHNKRHSKQLAEICIYHSNKYTNTNPRKLRMDVTFPNYIMTISEVQENIQMKKGKINFIGIQSLCYNYFSLNTIVNTKSRQLLTAKTVRQTTLKTSKRQPSIMTYFI